MVQLLARKRELLDDGVVLFIVVVEHTDKLGKHWVLLCCNARNEWWRSALCKTANVMFAKNDRLVTD